ncbi:hypothetical protein M422DRAFT_783061 [Sphaerobolus stellatus SS14]|uniref:Uncharacterized protein n=1 Tax=Sphaerobolus stellatus (strain SS14) TaxID=990650 RepID=A0A0C9TU32_SPHS4|nr:hypothetical protein M422DRAFT_783061 [Sphaerobolus stellatus SS14]
MAFLKLEIRRQHAIDGVAHKHVKRQYGQETIPTDQDKSASHESDIEDGDGDDEGKSEAYTFGEIVRRLQRQVDDDEDSLIRSIGSPN